ncbi:MAG: endonuclease IV, partial [Clostridia bacterium]|nr:endonuclease IV [Clostridia bacterium]
MIKFGPSGNSESFFAEGFSGTEEAAKWCRDRNLDCFEYSFGQGIRLKEEKAASIGNAFQNCGVELSVHAPYFINLATPEEEKAVNSFNYILQSGKFMKIMQGERVVFHPA